MGRKLRALHDERGQMLVLSAFVIVALLAFTGLIVDVGFHYAQRRQAQNATDQAAKAAAYEMTYGGSNAAAIQAALENAHDNGYNNDGVDNTVTVNIPPLSGPHVGDPNYVEVLVTEEPTTFFIHVVLGETGGVAARGVAGFTVTPGDPYALFVNNANCGNADSLEISGSSVLFNGPIHSNSNVNVPGSNNGFNGPVTYSDQVGCAFDISGSGNSLTPAPASAANRPFPLSYSYSDYPCTMTFAGDTQLTSEAAVWVGGNPSSGQMIPGTYCSTGSLKLSGSYITGNVTLVAQGKVNIAGSNFNLTPYWGNTLVFTEDSSNSAIDLSGSNGSWEGIMAAPNGAATIQGSSNLTISGAILADIIRISGSDFSLNAIDYGLGGPSDVALVE